MLESEAAAFISATPERLFRYEEGRILTEAVAGTTPLDVAGEPQFSEKDHREHALVVDDVRDRLAPLVHQVDADPAPGVLALRRRRHLRTRMRGAPRDGAGALDVLAALHPTPAVGGSPREAAREFIASHEGFDRGLYAGVVGRIGRDAAGRVAADFVVGIRSALITDREVALYAGAGLVPGSGARAEWAEIEGKMSDLAQALGLPGFKA
jgi:isochorismate synthase